jgi:hypothetical protein
MSAWRLNPEYQDTRSKYVEDLVMVHSRRQIKPFLRNILSLSSELKMEKICFSETLVSAYENAPCHNPEERCHHCRKNLKSCTHVFRMCSRYHMSNQ